MCEEMGEQVWPGSLPVRFGLRSWVMTPSGCLSTIHSGFKGWLSWGRSRWYFEEGGGWWSVLWTWGSLWGSCSRRPKCSGGSGGPRGAYMSWASWHKVWVGWERCVQRVYLGNAAGPNDDGCEEWPDEGCPGCGSKINWCVDSADHEGGPVGRRGRLLSSIWRMRLHLSWLVSSVLLPKARTGSKLSELVAGNASALKPMKPAWTVFCSNMGDQGWPLFTSKQAKEASDGCEISGATGKVSVQSWCSHAYNAMAPLSITRDPIRGVLQYKGFESCGIEIGNLSWVQYIGDGCWSCPEELVSSNWLNSSVFETFSKDWLGEALSLSDLLVNTNPGTRGSCVMPVWQSSTSKIVSRVVGTCRLHQLPKDTKCAASLQPYWWEAATKIPRALDRLSLWSKISPVS